MDQSGMTEAQAKSLLRALYKLDDPVGRLDSLLSSLPSGALRDQFKDALGDLSGIILSDLMVPIYRLHPQLGGASEPGPWLSEPG